MSTNKIALNIAGTPVTFQVESTMRIDDPLPTPENTPLPGGGSWHWDAALPGWVENTPPVENTLAPQTIPASFIEPTQE